MKRYNGLIKHSLIRLLIFPVIASVIYFIITTVSTDPKHLERAWSAGFFAAAAIVALVLMGEIIRFFTKKRLDKLVCNMGLILIILLVVIFVAPAL